MRFPVRALILCRCACGWSAAPRADSTACTTARRTRRTSSPSPAGSDRHPLAAPTHVASRLPLGEGAGGGMNSILETPETKPSTAGGGPGKALGMVGTGLAVVALGLATYLFVELRDARRQIAQLTEQASNADKRTKELDLGLAAVRGQTATIAERAGVTEAELEKTATAAQQLREEQRKGQEHLTTLGGEVGKVKDDVAASKAAIEETQAQLQRAIGRPRRAERAHRAQRGGARRLEARGPARVLRVRPRQGQVAVSGRPGGPAPEGRRRQAAQVQHGARGGRHRDREEGQDAPGARAVLPQGLAAAATRSSSSPSRRTGSPAT